jgi:hypothetical protein
LKAVEKGGMGSKGIREGTRRGSVDQNKVYPQWDYIEKPL